MNEELQIIHGGDVVGTLHYDRKKDSISLVYEESWQFNPAAFPISVSLPLARRNHPDGLIRPFLQGLLPDNPTVLERWGKEFHVSPRNPFDIIKHVGEDCAGAMQFVRPERVGKILSGELDTLFPLDGESLAARMEALQSPGGSGPLQEEGRFSLAGAQTKDALYWRDGQWFLPGGRIPSTHILKPQMEEFAEHSLNEHFCLCLADRIGLPAAVSQPIDIGGHRILCVERYDRLPDKSGSGVFRLHQEDTCQALGKFPSQKYQSEGGPSPREILRLLSDHSDAPETDIATFVRALALNWVIAGTDAHSKNYSLLHGPGSTLRLAPLYDVSSYLPYQRDPNSTHIKMAMKIGGSNRLHQIDAKSWCQLAEEAGLTADLVLSLARETVSAILEKTTETRDAIPREHAAEFLRQLSGAILRRGEQCLALLNA